MLKKITLATLLATSTFFSATVAEAEPREVRIASHVSALSPLHQQSTMFAEEIEKRLPGQFEFKLYPGGQLGKEKALVTNVKAGSIEMINVASGVMKLDKKLGLFDLPWLFTDREHVQRAMSGPLGQQVKARVEEKANVVVLGIYENGFRHVLNKVRAVSNPEDFKGLKIRVSGGKFRQNVFQQMGATPQKVAWTETFTALQTGVVDGAEAATYGFYEQKQYEAAKFLSLTSHVYTPSFLISSTAFWNSLTDEQKKVFAEVGQEITQKAYDGAAELEAKYFQDMKQFVEINDVDLNAFQDATRSSYDDYIKSQGDDWLKLVEDVK
ncbi:TRAP transporter substrate-binding protein [Terasakiella pusilla]|uniref:TRAP transporter substrate-binding protein n=1 Tax=Terasakiella pusilla TaxID=64973 RepID=UPI003AA88CE8